MSLLNILSVFSGHTKAKTKDAPEVLPQKKDKIGEVEAYYRKLSVAVIKVKKGPLRENDFIRIKGYTTDIKMKIKSLQVNHKPVSSARKGQSVGLKVQKRVRRGDTVYKQEAQTSR